MAISIQKKKRTTFLLALILIAFSSTPILLNQFFLIEPNYNTSTKEKKISTELDNPKLSNSDINILTPENKIYATPMSGYYPGTYGFEGGDWRDLINLTSSGNKAMILNEIDRHKDVIWVNDVVSSTRAGFQYDHGGSMGHGTVEFWFRVEGHLSEYGTTYVFLGGKDEYPWEMIDLYLENGKWRCKDGLNKIDVPNVPDPVLDHWYTIQVDWCRDDSNWQGLADLRWRVTINGISSGTLTYNNNNDYDPISFRCVTDTSNDDEYSIYYDVISLSWDPYYKLGNYANEGLLLSFENSTTLEWMGYSLDGQANITVYGNTTISMPNEGPHTIQVFGNDTFGTMYQSDIRSFSIEGIIILTPEAKVYTEPINGHYVGTYFGSTLPEGEWYNDTGPGCYCYFKRDSHYGHRNLLVLDDQYKSSRAGAEYDDGQSRGHGTAQFYFMISGHLSNGEKTLVFLASRHSYPYEPFQLFIENGEWIVSDGNDDIKAPNIPDPQLNMWYAIKVDWCRDGTGWEALANMRWQVAINGISTGNLVYNNNNDVDPEYFILKTQSNNDEGYTIYYDAFSFSWDPNYVEEECLEEGLLLSFESGTPLEWMGYSLGGQSNVTIYGNTTISMPENGSYTIQVFGKNSLGEVFESNIISFSVEESSDGNGDDNGDNDDDSSIDDKSVDDSSIYGSNIQISMIFLILIGLSVIIVTLVIGLVIYSKIIKRAKKRKIKGKNLKEKYMYCPFCYKKLEGTEKVCSYCGVSLYKEIDHPIPPILDKIEKIERDEYSIEEYYETIFTQSSNVLKIWIFDAKDKTKIYEETLDLNFSDIEKTYINLSEILSAEYERNTIIEKTLELEDTLIYLYIYWAGNPIILIFLSSKKINKVYLEFIEKAIKGIDENYQELRANPLKLRNFLDKNIFLYNSRNYGQISSSKQELIKKLFKSKEERELVLEDLKQLPDDIFSEFLVLYNKLIEELKFEKTRYTLNNYNFFSEGFD